MRGKSHSSPLRKNVQATRGKRAAWGGQSCTKATAAPAAPATRSKSKASQDVHVSDAPPTDFLYDAVIVGSGMGGLTTATEMASKGAKVVVLEKYATLPMPLSFPSPCLHNVQKARVELACASWILGLACFD